MYLKKMNLIERLKICKEMKDMYNGIINFMFPYGLAIILVIAYVMISKIKKSRRVI